MPKFTVDESISPDDAKQALIDLRRMIRYGRMAERAMKAIQTVGFYDGLAPLAPQVTHSQGKKKSNVRFVRLPLRLSISRDDLGPMSELKLEFDPVNNTKYSGNSCKEVPIYLNGPMAFQVASGLPKYEIRTDRRKIGTVRINKGHLSWLENAQYGTGGAWRIYKEMKYSGAKESLAAFSKGVSEVLTVLDNDSFVFSAKTLELRSTAWEWFLADGHAERIFRDIHEMISIVEVMEG